MSHNDAFPFMRDSQLELVIDARLLVVQNDEAMTTEHEYF